MSVLGDGKISLRRQDKKVFGSRCPVQVNEFEEGWEEETDERPCLEMDEQFGN
jgi:hypothetical protein